MVRTTKITVETETVTILRTASTALAWCPQCGAEVEVIATESGNLSSQIQEWHRAGKVHVWREASGEIRICLSSLLGSCERAEARDLRSLENQLDEFRRKP